MSELAPLPAAPRLALAVAGVEAPVPPLTNGKVPETSVAKVTEAGVQLVPLKRKTWPVVGTVGNTFTLRIRATVAAPDEPVTSPPIVTELFVLLTTILVRPAPLPKNAPTNR